MRTLRLLLASVASCAAFAPTAPRTPVDRAHELDAKCTGFVDANAARTLSPDVVDAVEPAYARIKGGPNGFDARLRGARIRMQPLSHATSETIQRTLACHQAGVLVGREPPLADDPYAAADKWLDIGVVSEGDGFAVLVETSDSDTARAVLERAKRFAANRAR